jgi:ABC-type polysaccharide/polyol phosphate export permease
MGVLPALGSGLSGKRNQAKQVMNQLGEGTTTAPPVNSAPMSHGEPLVQNFEPIAELGQNVAPPPQKGVSFPVYVFRTLNELRFIKFAFTSFVVNSLRRRYQRSILGFAWSLLSPLLMMIVLTAVFSLLFHRDPKTYGIFVFSGMLPWQFMSESISASCTAITQAEAFMKKVYIPKIFFPLVTVSTEFINFALSLVSMTFLAMFVGLQLHLTLLLLPFAMAITFAFIFGLGLSVSILTVYFRDFTHLVRVLLSCFFYLIPIVYPITLVPEKYRLIFQLNPFTYFVQLFRALIYDGQVPSLDAWLIPTGIALAASLIGLTILMKTEKDIIFRL